MAKLSQINRNKKREAMVARYAARRVHATIARHMRIEQRDSTRDTDPVAANAADRE